VTDLRVSINELDSRRIARKLNDIANQEYLVGAMQAGLSHLKSGVAEYPPATDANQPYQRRWYERNWGGKWMRADGSVGGRKSSEMLGKSWATRVENRGRRGVLGTKVSYAPFVQDKTRQASFHARRGWKTVQDVLHERGERVVEGIQKAIERLWST
jgi:hypothetical protein